MEIKENISLKDYSTFKIGGPAKFFCVVSEIGGLRETVEWAENKREKLFVLGGGSNILFSDKGFDGLVIKVENDKLESGNNKIICGAGVRLGDVVLFSINNNLTGLEWAIGIPGTVGGAVRGNAGAFGRDMSDSVVLVKGLKIDELGMTEMVVDKEGCDFGYRNSAFKQDKKLLIWEIELAFEAGRREDSKRMAGEFLNKRKVNQPNGPSAGSIFQNPQVSPEIVKEFEKDQQIECRDNKVPAGWLIDECGLRGMKIGGAQVSPRHANFIINTGEATAEEVVTLISIIKQKVRANFGVQLREEIEMVL